MSMVGACSVEVSRGRRSAVFAVVALALLMSSLDQTIVATALDAVRDGTGASLAWVSWTLTVYSLGLMVMLPLSGTLSDRFGRRRVFVSSVVLFTAASLACGLTSNIYVLVIFRAIQAIGGAGFTPSATGIVVQYFGSARDKAVGLFGSIFPIGATIGPVVGGVLVTYWSWRSVFLVNVPIGLLLIPCALRAIPPDRPVARDRRSRLDVRGMVLLGLGVLGAMIAFTFIGVGGGRALAIVLGSAISATVLLVLFGRHVARATYPFISPRLIVGRGFAAVNTINVMYGGAMAGLVALVPLYVTSRYGMDALRAGSVLAAEGIAVIVCSTSAAFLLRRTGYRMPLYAGSLVAALGVGALALPPLGMSAYLWVALAGCVIGIGQGSSNPASRNAGLQLAPEQASSIAALRTMSRQVGTIIAVSVATAIVTGAGNHGLAHAYVYAASAALFVLVLPVIARIPEHRGSW